MKEIVTIMFGLGLLLGLQGCSDKEGEYEPAEGDAWGFPVPEDKEEKIDLDDPAEEALPYKEEQEFDDPADSEEEQEPDPDTEEPLEEEDLEEPGLDEPEIEDDKEL